MSKKYLPDIFKPKEAQRTPEQGTPSVFGAMARTAARLKEREAALLAAKEAEALAKIERRFTPHMCAVTGVRWMTEWRKGQGDLLFTRHADKPLTSASGLQAASEAAPVTFVTAEFEWGYWSCPQCGTSAQLVICHCGSIVCGGKTVIREGRLPRFNCHPSCGCSFDVSGVAAEVPGEKAQRPHAPRSGAIPAAKAGPLIANAGGPLQLPDHSKHRR